MGKSESSPVPVNEEEEFVWDIPAKLGVGFMILAFAGLTTGVINKMKNGREQEQLTPSTPIKQADTKTTPIHSSYSSVQDMEAQSVVNGENYLQIISELEEKQKHDPNYKPNAIELAALEWKRVKELFDSIEPKK